jgi:succinate dehydrogenase/fumarate reductase cytochrome b subunit
MPIPAYPAIPIPLISSSCHRICVVLPSVFIVVQLPFEDIPLGMMLIE